MDAADPSSSSLTSSFTIRYLDWDRGLVVSADEERQQSGICSLQDIGGHIMKIPFIAFQILLFMHLEVQYILVNGLLLICFLKV